MPTDHRFRFEDSEGGAPAHPEARQADPEEAIGGVQGQSLPTALQHGDLMAQGKILRLQRQPGSEARPQGMKEDAKDCFHGMARLPAEGANRNDFNAVGIIGVWCTSVQLGVHPNATSGGLGSPVDKSRNG